MQRKADVANLPQVNAFMKWLELIGQFMVY